jgi:hypothetical protein
MKWFVRPGQLEPSTVWRDGPLLVAPLEGRLPKRCVKSNKPTGSWVWHRYDWQSGFSWETETVRKVFIPVCFMSVSAVASSNYGPNWLDIVVVGPVLLLLFLRTFSSREINLAVGLSRAWRRRRWYQSLPLSAAFWGGIAMLSYGSAFFSESAATIAETLLVGLLLLIAHFQSRAFGLIWPTRATDRFVWLAGVNPEYLAELPEFPGEAVAAAEGNAAGSPRIGKGASQRPTVPP